ncbi:MAG: hypothetical protein NZ922_00150 [Candidatus Methanomethyliaceae archaeon]|nr:hypothetical protein [Candidatus Methanomethyliaceae archaeon]
MKISVRLRGITEKRQSCLKIFAIFLEKHGLGISDITINMLREFLQHVIYT